MQLVLLFVQTDIKRKTLRSSCSQMFFKMAVFKECWSLFFMKLPAWRTTFLLKRNSNTDVFLWKLWNFQQQLFLQDTSCSLYFSEILCDDRCFGRLWVQNWHFSYFLCHYFVFLHDSIRITVPWLFRASFHTKLFSKCKFHTH